MVHATHEDVIPRLRRIEGQVRGVIRMIEEERYCMDILVQLQAVKAALGRVEAGVLKRHAAHCVDDALASGDPTEQRAKFEELAELCLRY